MSTRVTAKMEGSVGAPALPMFGGGPSTPMGAPARSPALLGGGFGAVVVVAPRAQASRQEFKEAVLDRGGPCDIGFRTGGAQVTLCLASLVHAPAATVLVLLGRLHAAVTSEPASALP